MSLTIPPEVSVIGRKKALKGVLHTLMSKWQLNFGPFWRSCKSKKLLYSIGIILPIELSQGTSLTNQNNVFFPSDLDYEGIVLQITSGADCDKENTQP